MKAFGDRLKQAREARSVTIRSVAASTRISERYLQALERSDLDALPGGVFDKGYIKAYAQFLEIDPKPLLESYGIEERKRGRGTPEAEQQKLQDLARLVGTRPSAPSVGSNVRAGIFVVLVLAGVLGAVGWLVFRSPAPEPTPKPRRSLQSATLTRSLTTTQKPEPAIVEAPKPALSVAQAGVGTGVAERNLVGRNDRFPDGSKVWFWTRIVGGKKGDSVRHRWRHAGRVYMNARLPVGGSHWRTYSTLELPPGTVGEWTVEVVDGSGAVLESESFESVSPEGGT